MSNVLTPSRAARDVQTSTTSSGSPVSSTHPTTGTICSWTKRHELVVAWAGRDRSMSQSRRTALALLDADDPVRRAGRRCSRSLAGTTTEDFERVLGPCGTKDGRSVGDLDAPLAMCATRSASRTPGRALVLARRPMLANPPRAWRHGSGRSGTGLLDRPPKRAARRAECFSSASHVRRPARSRRATLR